MEEEIAEIVRQHGWYAANVADHHPKSLYTIGLMHTLEHPELIIFGLEPDNAYALFSQLVMDIGNERSYAEPGVYTISIGERQHRVGFRRVHPTQHELYLGFAMGYCRYIGRWGELEAMQVFWPDSNGKFPFEAGCELEVHELQPRLDISLTPRELREWRLSLSERVPTRARSMRPVDIIRSAQAQKLFDEDGNAICISLLPPLSDAEINEFAKCLPCALPADIRELLQYCRGFEGVVADIVDFTGRDRSFEETTVFPYGLPIAGDGFGNFWVVDLFPESAEFGPIYFACHDAPVVLYQSRTLSDFLTELFRACVSLRGSAIDDVHEDRIYNVWPTNPGVIAYEDCLRSSDRVLQSFAAELDPSWYVVDLRDAQPGMGFSWGRYGPNTNIRRCGTLPVFAVQKKGFLGPFFG